VKKKILLGIVAAVIFVGLVGAAIVYNFGFRQRFEVVSAAKIRIFLNVEETQELQQGQTLTWGSIENTDPQHQTLYVKNTGTANVTLQFNYNPGQQMPQDWTLSWDYDSNPVLVGETETVTMTLTLPSTIGAGTYECDSGIAATPVP
jgi:ABC-type antimicrobial peptide transport system permease subunit